MTVALTNVLVSLLVIVVVFLSVSLVSQFELTRVSSWIDTLELIWSGVVLACLGGNHVLLDVPCPEFPLNPVDTLEVAFDGIIFAYLWDDQTP